MVALAEVGKHRLTMQSVEIESETTAIRYP